MTQDDEAQPLYDIAELARLGAVTRRTVRYYVQRGLIPAPTGTGRGKHYTAEHLEALVRVRELQAAGVTLTEIEAGDAPSAPAEHTPPEQEAWIRLHLGDDLELHLRRPRALDAATAHKLAQAIRSILDEDP